MKRRHHGLISIQAILSSCVASVVLSFFPTSACAQALDEGLEAYLDADFRRAASLLEEALRSGDLSRGERATALIHYAALQMIFDDRARALELTELAAALDPHVQAPDGVDVAITETLNDARVRLEESPLELLIEAVAPLTAGQRAEIIAVLEPEAASLDLRLDLRCQPPQGPRLQDGNQGPSVTLAFQVDDGPLDCRSILRTDDGIVLLRARETFDVEGRRSRRGLALGLGLGLGGTALVTVVVVLAVVLSGRQVPIDDILVEGW
jgi:hypothetical protein